MLLHFKPVQLLVWCPHLGYPSERQFAYPQDFCQSSMNRPDIDAQSQLCVWWSHACHSSRYDESLHLGIAGSWFGHPVPFKMENPLHHDRIADRNSTKCFDHIIMDFLGRHTLFVKTLNNCCWIWNVMCRLHTKDTCNPKIYVHLYNYGDLRPRISWPTLVYPLITVINGSIIVYFENWTLLKLVIQGVRCMFSSYLFNYLFVCLFVCLFVWSFTPISTHFCHISSAVGPHKRLSWITKQWSPISPHVIDY